MGRLWLLATGFFGFVTVAVAAEEKGAKQPNAPAVPPARVVCVKFSKLVMVTGCWFVFRSR